MMATLTSCLKIKVSSVLVANNESSEVVDIIKPGRRVKIKRLQAVICQKRLTIRYSRAGCRLRSNCTLFIVDQQPI